jgi:DNA polymerase III epsilon subunit-like protein
MILFFDTETTGIRKNGFVPRVVQIGALLTDDQGKTLAELNVLLKPEGFDNVPIEAANVHGFSYELISTAGIDRSVGLVTFFELVDMADTLVAHNIEFDLDLMNIEIQERLKKSDPMTAFWKEALDKPQHFCTMINSRDTLMMPLSDAQARFFRDTGNDQKFKNPRLIEAYQHFFHKDFEGAHDAMADVRACRDVFFELHKLKQPVEA